jgi:hypothetical protein
VAGPPFRTDDPEPAAYGHWEFSLGSHVTSAPGGVSGSAPHVEINFGNSPDMQIHMIAPFSYSHPDGGRATYGLGDLEIGLKYRFINETPDLPQVGTFPLVETQTGNAAKGLGVGNVQLFIPLWLQKSWGEWTTYGGGGYLANIKRHPDNSWFVGWEVERDLSDFLTLGAELFSSIFPSDRSEDEIAFNIGTIVNFSDNHHILLSAGRDIVGHRDLFAYAAYQLTIGPASK